MHQRSHFFFWVILLLVGLSFVTPDPEVVTPDPTQGPAFALIDSDDDDDPDRSRASTLVVHAHPSIWPLAISLTCLTLFGRLQPPTQSTAPQFLLLSLRSPRSPTAN